MSVSGTDRGVRRLRLLAIVETVSFLCLLAAMLVHSDVGVSIIGAAHGLLFLGYALLVWTTHARLGWTQGFALLAILTGPIGPIIVLERLRREAAAAI